MPGYKVMKYPGSTQAVFSAHLCAMKKNYYAIGGSHGVRIIAGLFDSPDGWPTISRRSVLLPVVVLPDKD
jgi:hypothetical protein